MTGKEVVVGTDATYIPFDVLNKNADVILFVLNRNIKAPAYVSQGKWHWWIADTPWSGNEIDKGILELS